MDVRAQDKLWEAFCLEQSEGAFLPLFESTKSLVYSICFRILHNEEDVSDAFQAVYGRLIALAKHPDEHGAVEDVAKLARRLAVREADRLYKQRIRRNRREVAMESYDLPDSGLAPDQMAANRQLREKIEVLVAQLPEPYRLPLLLHYFQGMTHQEIADDLDKSINTISTNIRRGLKKLHPLMLRAGLGETLTLLGALAATGELLSPPSALAGSVVFAKANATLVVGGSALAVGTSGATVSKTLLGVSLMKAKVAIISTIIAIGIVGLLIIGLNQGEHEPNNPAVVSPAEQNGSDAAQARDSIL